MGGPQSQKHDEVTLEVRVRSVRDEGENTEPVFELSQVKGLPRRQFSTP